MTTKSLAVEKRVRKRAPVARDLMSRPVRQVTAATPVREAAAFLLRHRISGAPVLDEHGQWIGVFTQNDLARYVQGQIVPRMPERTLESREPADGAVPAGLDQFGDAPVRRFMTPGMYTVFSDASLDEIVHALVTFKIHRVFVIDGRTGSLEGIITTMDVMRALDRRHAGGKRPAKARRA
jgi:tRNA nucleotidyltransferase (CCA-adding enzyme)